MPPGPGFNSMSPANKSKWMIVELLIGFVCFCALYLLNAPWRMVPLLLPLFGSVSTDLAQCLTIVLSEINRGQKDPTF